MFDKYLKSEEFIKSLVQLIDNGDNIKLYLDIIIKDNTTIGKLIGEGNYQIVFNTQEFDLSIYEIYDILRKELFKLYIDFAETKIKIFMTKDATVIHKSFCIIRRNNHDNAT